MIALLLALSSSDATLHVAPQGRDAAGSGTQARPYQSLGYAIAQLGGKSATIRLAPGTYTITAPIAVPPKVSIVGNGATKTILRGNLKDQKLLVLDSPELTKGDQRIQGIGFDGMNRSLMGAILVNNRHGITLQGLKFVNIREAAAIIDRKHGEYRTAEPEYVLNTKVLQCEFVNCGFDFEKYSGGNLEIGGLNGALVSDIKIRSQNGYGIKFVGAGYFRNTKVTNCDIEMRETDRLWGECIAIELWNLGPGNEVSNIRSNVWLSLVNHHGIHSQPKGYENLLVKSIQVVDQDGKSTKEGIELGVPGTIIENATIVDKGFGIAIWDAGTRNVLIRNCIIANTAVKENWAGAPGIFVANSTKLRYENMIFENNVFERCRHGIMLSCDGPSGFDQITVRNNLFLHTPTDGAVLAYRGTNNNTTDSVGRVTLANNIYFPASNLINDLAKASKGLDQKGNQMVDPKISGKGPFLPARYQPTSRQSPLTKGSERIGLQPKG